MGRGVVTCAVCGLYRCACRNGRTTVTAEGSTPEDAIARARAYVERRGYRAEVLGVKRRRVKTGLLGYRAWDVRFEVTR